MKNLILLVTFLTANSAFANYQLVNCDSIVGTENSMQLIVVNNDVKQIRVTSGMRTKAFIPNKLQIQNIENKTIYTVVGIPGLFQVENTVLNDGGGIVQFANDEFSCN
jgi:hypothetical protein